MFPFQPKNQAVESADLMNSEQCAVRQPRQSWKWNIETHQTKVTMKRIKHLFNSSQLSKRLGTYLAACATVAAVGIAAGNFHTRAAAAGGAEEPNNTQIAELYELQAAFHEAASHGGNIDAMMELWADDSSLTAGGVRYSGKEAVRTFFATVSGAFKHDRVS